MVIERDRVMPLLLAACPSFVQVWRTVAEEDGRDDGPGGSDGVEGRARLHYADAATFADHVATQLASGRTSELPGTFAVLERLHVEGDAYVRELATVGYLESLQSALPRHGVPPDVALGWLGPESRRWWRGLDAFWSGTTPPPVRPADEAYGSGPVR